MPTIAEQIASQREKLKAKEEQLAKIPKLKAEIKNLNDSITALEFKDLSETMSDKGVTIADVVNAVKSGAVRAAVPTGKVEKEEQNGDR